MRHLYVYRCIAEVAKAGSIRKAAEGLAITPSALNRRILGLEDELGVQIFERLPRGVRLSTAGELLIHHIRNQLSDVERLKSQIADLSGIRRGHVNIACSQALLPYFLPQQIEIYRSRHPGVSFGVFVRDREAAERALQDYSADVALIVEPVRLAECQTMLIVRQPICAVMGAGHPLARRRTVKLEEVQGFPLALPSRPYGVRTLLDAAAARKNIKLEAAIESDSFEFLRYVVRNGPTVAFQIPIGLPAAADADTDIVSRPLSDKEVPPGRLHLAQLRGRSLPVAAAR
ncbi:MAG: LysR family transcriptional regulator, partial [Hyphomicrobiaceae bacterium]|nr:LysR family transcriptional regulator [Hyphomicrobiaceae bacterium]